MSKLDDAGLWWESRHSDIQDYDIPEEKPDSFIDIDTLPSDDEPERVTAADVRNELNLTKLNEPTAKIIVALMDVVLPLAFVFIVKGGDKQALKLDEDERETLTSAWAEYLKTTSFAMSPGGILATTIVTIYGAKITVAMMERRQKQEEIEALREQNELLKQQAAKIEDKEAENEA